RRPASAARDLERQPVHTAVGHERCSLRNPMDRRSRGRRGAVEGGQMIELLNGKWMAVAMVAMAATATGCAMGEGSADELDVDEADVVEVDEAAQAMCGGYPGLPGRNCGRWP